MPPPSAPIRLPWKLAPLIVVAAAWLAFLGVARHTWVLDDVRLVRDNSEVARGPSAIAGLLAEGSPRDAEMDDYGPLTMASFALEAPLWRQADGSLRPAGFHLTNLLLHGLCVLLLLQVLLQLAPGRPVIALGGALVFAVHPLQAAAVAPLMGRAILLAAGFSLLTVLAWRAWTRGRIAGLPVALACWLLALLSHVAALGVPLVVLLLDRALPARERAGRAWSWAGLAFLLPLGAFLGLWSGLAPGPIDLPAQGLGARLAVGAEGWVRLILGLVIPVGARGDHTDEALGGVGFEVDAATLACVGFVVVVTIGILLRVRAGRAGAPALIWLAGLALAVPAAALLPAGRPLEARWGYLAALALVPAAGLLAGALLRSGRLSAGALRLRAAVVGALAIILLVGLAQRGARAWRDDDAFHERLLARKVRLVERDGWTVAERVTPGPTLTSEQVRKTLSDLREGRTR